VAVASPLKQTMARSLRFTGDVVPLQQAQIFSKVSGNLDRVLTDIGSGVRRGQLLALVDTTELAQQMQQAAATYKNTVLNHRRTLDLYGQSLVSRQDKENADAALAIAEAAFEAARTRLGYARITAPFDGTITRRYLDPGALVGPGTGTLFLLMDLREMKIIINVREKDIPLLRTGTEASVTVDAFPGSVFTGRVTRFSQAVDLGTRTMPVEVDIPNTDGRLKPGMYATVMVIIERRANALTVPTMAVLKDDAGSYLFVAESDTARRVLVATGIDDGNRTEITSGLAGTEAVIVEGQQLVRPGAPVLVQR
jgi:membrane fusion protein (multidrug efflux system)